MFPAIVYIAAVLDEQLEWLHVSVVHYPVHCVSAVIASMVRVGSRFEKLSSHSKEMIGINTNQYNFFYRKVSGSFQALCWYTYD